MLTSLLIEGSKLLATSAAGEFAKGAGKTAFEALKGLLTGKHEAQSLGLLDQAGGNDAFRAAIESELAKAGIAADPEVLKLAQTVQAAIAALPPAELAAAAIDAETIRARGNQWFEDVEGIRAGLIESGGDQVFKGIKAPGK